ncbi:MAG: hypothetical protein LUF68_04300 [Clostridiales bacterium]|nr:hypothetical protein [Clostridiales bacterium]
MADSKKPRLCEVLGVEVNQRFVVETDDYKDIINRINTDGDRETKRDGTWAIAAWEHLLVEAINHPEVIRPLPCWTEWDVADAKAVRRLFPQVDAVEKGESGRCLTLWNGVEDSVMTFDGGARMFPSLKPGACADLDEILEAEHEQD